MLASTVKTKELKRLNVALPDTLYQRLEDQAEEQQTTITDLLRRYIRLGLTADLLLTPGATLLVREGSTNKERELIIV